MKNYTSSLGAFREAVWQLALVVGVATLSIIMALVVDSLPVTADASASPWRLLFGAFRALKYSLPVLGFAVGVYHVLTFKASLGGKLGLFVFDLASVIFSVAAAAAMAQSLALASAFSPFWSASLHLLGGLRSWQAISLASMAFLIPGGILVLGLLIEFIAGETFKILTRKREHGGTSSDKGGTVNLKQRFGSPMAVSRVKERVSSAINEIVADLGETARSSIRWILDDTVEITLSSPAVSGERLAITLASAMAEISNYDDKASKIWKGLH